MTDREKATAELLPAAMRAFERSLRMLAVSVRQVAHIDLAKPLDETEESLFEALTARFARASDIQLRKVFRLLDRLELEEEGTNIDVLNRAAKRGLITDPAVYRTFRELRNEISHEYSEDAPKRIYQFVREAAPELIESLPKIKEYAAELMKKLG